MANPDTPGNETTEYKIARWIVIIGGILTPIIAGVAGFLAKQPEPSEAGLIAMGIIGAAVTGVVGWASKIYTQSRTALKVAKVAANGKAIAPANPT